MANRNFPCNKLYQFDVMPVMLSARANIGASGAVSSISGGGVASITRMAPGTYQVQLQDNYSFMHLAMGDVGLVGSGSTVAVTSGLVVGTLYRIFSVGTTTQAQWRAIGLQAGVTPNVNDYFVATSSTPSSGTGSVQPLIPSNIDSIQFRQITSTLQASELFPAGLPPLQGGYLIFQTLASTSSSDTTLIPTDPISGSSVVLMLYMSNSSVLVGGQ